MCIPFPRFVAIEDTLVNGLTTIEQGYHIPVAACRTFSALGTITVVSATPIEDVVNSLYVQVLVPFNHPVAVRRAPHVIECRHEYREALLTTASVMIASLLVPRLFAILSAVVVNCFW